MNIPLTLKKQTFELKPVAVLFYFRVLTLRLNYTT